MTNTPKHTPGPWAVVAYCKDMVTIQTTDTGIFQPKVIIQAFDCVVGTEQEANAHLIASAPEMLEALEQVEQGLRAFLNENPRFLGETHGTTTMGIYLNKLKSAIAKAEGRL